MSDAQRLSDGMTRASEILIELVGLTIGGAELHPGSVDRERIPLVGYAAAVTALRYLMVGVGVLDDAIEGTVPVQVPFDDGLRALLGGGA